MVLYRRRGGGGEGVVGGGGGRTIPRAPNWQIPPNSAASMFTLFFYDSCDLTADLCCPWIVNALYFYSTPLVWTTTYCGALDNSFHSPSFSFWSMWSNRGLTTPSWFPVGSKCVSVIMSCCYYIFWSKWCFTFICSQPIILWRELLNVGLIITAVTLIWGWNKHIKDEWFYWANICSL